MKPEESIKILRKRIDLIKQDWSDMADLVEYQKALERAVKALEKQIPCKPEEYVPDFPYNIFSTQKCAKCGTPVIGKKISKYCSECGQKIDWGEE